MGHSLAETPLAIFTVLAPMAALAFVCIGILWLSPLRCLIISTEDRIFLRKRMVRNMLYIWIVLVVGFLAASMHMHYPLHAPFALVGIGRSPLTNEILSGVLFMACGGLWWLYKLFEYHPLCAKVKLSSRAQIVWLVIAMVLAVLFCVFIGIAYYIQTVPAWHTLSALVLMFMLGLITGPALAAFIVIISGINHRRIHSILFCVSIFALAAFCIALSFFTRFNIEYGNSVVHSAISSMPYYTPLLLTVYALVLCAFILWYVGISRFKITGKRMFVIVLILGVALLISRFMFYGMHLTQGLA